MIFLKSIAKAGQLWWYNFFTILLINLLWFLLQIPVITGPPATAAFFIIGRRIVDGEIIIVADLWPALRAHFWQSWLWGLLNLVVTVAIVGNLYAYAGQIGLGWTALRIFWIICLLLWLATNLFYWPLWLDSGERATWQTTFSLALQLIITFPLVATGTVLLIGLLGGLGAALVLPIPFGAVGFLVLYALLTVDGVTQAENRPSDA